MRSLIRFIAIIALFLMCFILSDYALGKILDRMQDSITNDGSTASKISNTLTRTKYSTLIFGSSRAYHNYIPKMFDDSLGTETFNCGTDGCFFYFCNSIIQSTICRYSPRMIIWENGMDYLYKDIPIKEKWMYMLFPYYDKFSHIKEGILANEKDNWLKYKMLFHTFRYNSLALSLALKHFRHQNIEDPQKGYVPIPYDPHKTPLKFNLGKQITNPIIDPDKVKQLEQTFKMVKAKGIHLVMVDSPSFQRDIEHSNDKSYAILKLLSQKYGVTLIDNKHNAYFMHHPELFDDNIHLNERGAAANTKLIISQIKEK